MYNISINHFIDRNLFDEVKRDFLSRDFIYSNAIKNYEVIDVDLTANKIKIFQETVKSYKTEFDNLGFPYDINEIEVKELEIDFFKDYLPKKIQELEEFYKKQFISEIQNKNIYSDNALKNYCQIKFNEINQTIDLVRKSNFLQPELIIQVVSVLENLYQFLNEDYYKHHIDNKSKIPLYITKNETITFFHLLYQNRFICPKNLYLNDLWKLIEQCFTFYDKKNKTFREISKARELELELFGPNPSRNPKKSIESIKRKFQSSDFYT